MSTGNKLNNNGRWKGKNRNYRSFKTDKEITKQSHSNRSNRTLQKFEGGDDDELFGSLEDINRGKGEKFDQFAVNEKEFGVKSTYSNDLYTTKLDRDDEFYKLNEKRAEEIEKEISLLEVTNRHVAEERGLVIQHEDGDEDEESKYSSVQTPEDKKKQKIHSAWSQSPVIKEKFSENTSTSSSPMFIKRRKDSTGLKGRHSGSSSPLLSGSPKSTSSLERSMKNLNLDCPSPTFSKKQKEDFTDFVQKELDLERKKVKEDLKNYKKENEKKLSTSNAENNNEKENEKKASTSNVEKSNEKENEKDKEKEKKEDKKEEKKEEEFKSTLNPDAEEFTPPMYIAPGGFISIPLPYDQFYYPPHPYYPYPPQSYMYNQYYSNEHERKPKKHINKVYSESMERKIRKNKKNYGENKQNGKSENDWSNVVQYEKDSYKDPTPLPHYRPNEFYPYPSPMYVPGYNAPMIPYDSNVQPSYPTYPYQ